MIARSIEHYIKRNLLTILLPLIGVSISPVSDASLVNQESQEPVLLIQPFWSVRDFNDRTIVCEKFDFSRAAGRYLSASYQDQFIVRHHAVANEVPEIGFTEFLSDGDVHLNYARPFWTVVNGKYKGSLFYLESSEIEAVNDNGIAKIRVWGDWEFNYRECWAIDGSSFQPTGYEGEPLEEYAAVESNLAVSEYAEPIPTDSPQNFINIANGLPVILERVVWDVRRDLIGRQVECRKYEWSDEWGGHYGVDNYHKDTYLFFPPPGTSPNTVPVSSNLGNVTLEIKQGVQYGPRFVMAPVVERTRSSEGTRVVRIWESSQNYLQCRILYRIDRQMNFAEVVEDLAPVTANESTEAFPMDAGDFSMPAEFPYCIDSDFDGWGWDGTSSCRIGRTATGTCEDPDGDYWGWDGSVSCEIPR